MHACFPFGIQAAEAGGYTQYVQQAGGLIQANLYFKVQLIHGTEGLVISVCVMIPFLFVNTFLVISVTVLVADLFTRGVEQPHLASSQ